jgi:hypothetical protein
MFSAMELKVLTYTFIGRGYLLGECDVVIVDKGIELYGCKIFRKDDKTWVNTPETSIRLADGTYRTKPHIKLLSSSDREVFTMDVLSQLAGHKIKSFDDYQPKR